MCVVTCVSTPHSKPEELALLVVARKSLGGSTPIYFCKNFREADCKYIFGGVVDAPLCSLAVCVIDQGAALECQLAPLTYATVV